MKKNLGIFILMHKKANVFKRSNYYKLHLGAINGRKFNADYYDDDGYNISDKNQNYCELTGIYNIWKNHLNDFDIFGFVHYRRYFVRYPKLKFKFNCLNSKYIMNKLNDYDIILPRKIYFEKSAYKSYFEDGEGYEKDLINLKKVIEKIYPEYISTYDEVMNFNANSYCNMFITTRENFDKYCKWLFDILFELEKITDLTGYTGNKLRIYGYLSEILINVWVKYNKLKVSYSRVLFTGK